MRALVMAAGLGTRLRPLTDRTPKPLVPLLGRPMVEYVLEHLAKHGIKEALINIHYLPDQMRDFVEKWNQKSKLPKLFLQDESKMILGSGGAIALGSSWLFEKNNSALVCNSDVIATPNLELLIKKHNELVAKYGVECTLCVTPHAEAGNKYTGIRLENDLISEFVSGQKTSKGLLIFPGFYAIEKTALKRMPNAGSEFSITEKVWRPEIKDKKLGAWIYEGTYLDLGTPADLKAAESYLKSQDL